MTYAEELARFVVNAGFAGLSMPARQQLKIRVLDSLEGTGPHQVEVYFHFYPGALISLHLDPKLQCSQEQTSFHPGFDLSLPNQTIVGCCHLACPASFETNIFLD